jgi:hypothetical protein
LGKNKGEKGEKTRTWKTQKPSFPLFHSSQILEKPETVFLEFPAGLKSLKEGRGKLKEGLRKNKRGPNILKGKKRPYRTREEKHKTNILPSAGNPSPGRKLRKNLPRGVVPPPRGKIPKIPTLLSLRD